MKVVSETPGMRDFTIEGGSPITKDKDGRFNVSDQLGKNLVKSGEFMAVGITLRTAPGYRCQKCNHLGVFKNKCRCGSSKLKAEG